MNPLLIPLIFKLIDFAFFAAEAHLDTTEVRAHLKVLQEKGEQIGPEDMAKLDEIIDGKLEELRQLAEGDTS